MFHWGKVPLVRLFFAFALGILSHDKFYLDFQIVLIVSLVLLPLLLLSLKLKFSYYRRWLPGLFYLLVSFAGGYFASSFHSERVVIFPEKGSELYYGQIIDHPEEKQNSVKAIIKVISEKDSTDKYINSEVLTYFEKDNNSLKLEVGNKVYFQAGFQHISGRKNPATFDYANFMNRKYIYQQVYLPSEEWKLADNDGYYSLVIIAKKLQRYVKNIFEKYLNNAESLAIVSALVVGDKSELDAELKQGFSVAGAMHVLAVSGLHVGIIYKVLEFLFNLFFKSKKQKKLQAYSILLILWSYAFITGLSPSVLRAVWMFSFIVVANLKLNNPNVYNTLAASAFFILVMNPNYLFHVGFQLSYVAVLGIVSIYPLLFNRLKSKNRIWNAVWGLTVVSFAAQISTFPIALFYFHQFPTYFLLSNYIAIPMAFILLSGGLLLIGAHFVSTQLAEWLGWLIDQLGDFLANGIGWISSLPLASIDQLWISTLQLILIYAILFFLVCAFQLYWKKGIFISLTCAVLVFLSFLLKSYQAYNQDNVVLYSIRDGNVIAVIQSDEAYIYSDIDSITDRPDWKFSIQPVLDSLGVSHVSINNTAGVDWVISSDIYENHLIQTINKTIVVQKNDLSVIAKLDPKSTIVVIDKKATEKGVYSNSSTYLSSNLKPWELREWRKTNNHLYSLSEKGLFLKDNPNVNLFTKLFRK